MAFIRDLGQGHCLFFFFFPPNLHLVETVGMPRLMTVSLAEGALNNTIIQQIRDFM